MADRKGLTEQVYSYMKRWEMTAPGDTVVLGLSGGADSTGLLSVLLALRDRLGIRLRAVHVHHGLRGEEADRDAAFARDLCSRTGIPFRAEYIDAAAEAEKTGTSVEEAGRNARYRILSREAEAFGSGGKIAAAHHADDNTETVLMNLFRGTGLQGLGGIRPVQGRIIRPLLFLRKREICEYLAEQGISWVEDSTNLEQEYTRNYVRGTLLPGVREHVNAGADRNILRTARFAAEADLYFRNLALEKLEEIRLQAPENGKSTGDGSHILAADAGKLAREPRIVQEYLVRGLLRELGCPQKDIGSGHIEDVLGLCRKETGKMVMLPYGVTAQMSYGKLLLSRPEEAKTGGGIPAAEAGKLPEEGDRFTFRLIPRAECGKIPAAEYTKWLDYATIMGTLSVRYRREGDYICVAPGVKKTLHRYMIDEKIPAGLRDRIPLLADGSHILWIVGYRISWACRITGQTEKVLQVTYSSDEGGKNIGRENQGPADEGRSRCED